MNLGGSSSKLPKSWVVRLSQGLQTSMLPAPPLRALPVPTAVWGVLAAHASALSGQTEPTAPPCRPGGPSGQEEAGLGVLRLEEGLEQEVTASGLCLLGSLCAGCTCSPVPQGAAWGGVPRQGPGPVGQGHFRGWEYVGWLSLH